MYTLYLLDLDGLLIDTEALHFEAYQIAARGRDIELKWSFAEFKQYAHVAKGTLREALSTLIPSLLHSEKEWAEFYKAKQCNFQQIVKGRQIHLMAGAREFLRSLQEREVLHCVVTNSTGEQVALLRARCPTLQSIENWIVREDYQRSKPSPDGYLAALAKHKTDPQHAIGFEDSSKGLTALVMAGVKGVLIAPHPPRFSGEENPLSSGDWSWYIDLNDWLKCQK